MADDKLADFADELTDFVGGTTALPDSTPVTNIPADDPTVHQVIDGIVSAADNLTLE